MIPFHLKGSHRQNVTCLVSSESVGQKKCQKQLHKIVQGNAESRKFVSSMGFWKNSLNTNIVFWLVFFDQFKS